MTEIELRAERDEKQDGRKPPQGRKRRPLVTGLVAAGALAGFAIAVGYAYQKGRDAGTSGVVPIIAAQPGPFKVRPENPGGMTVPNRDMEIYDRVTGVQQPASPRRESLLPGPEQPVLPPRPATAEGGAAAPTEENVAAPAVVPPPPPTMPPADGAARSIAEATGAAAQPNGRKAPQAPAATTTKPAATDTAARRAGRVAPGSGGLASRGPGAEGPASRVGAAGGSYRVQLGALRSDAAARGAWSRLQKQHGDLLGSLALSIDRKDLGGGKGVYYRMQAGPLASEADARGLCSRLKQRHVDCLIVSL